MALRATKPEPVQKRLKLFVFGPAGVGKTTCAIQFPRSYIIDAERGTENYDDVINKAGGAVFKTSDVDEVMTEVRSLRTEKHDFRTLVIDPITPIYDDLVDKCAAKVGTEWGRHYQEAGRQMKRLVRFLIALDMNVIMTAHGKWEYDDSMRKAGQTFDGWRKLDYLFDLVLDLSKKGKVRRATVRKTRIASFPDEDVFNWSYEEFVNRYGREVIEREAGAIQLASDEQIKLLRGYLEAVKLPDGTVEKWLDKAGVDTFEDMPADVIAKCIDFVKARIPAAV